MSVVTTPRVAAVCELVGIFAHGFRFAEADVADVGDTMLETALRGGTLDDVRATAGAATYRNGFRRSPVADRAGDFHRLARHAREKLVTLERELADLTRRRDELAKLLTAE